MPSLTLDNKGLQFFFTDTGRPNNGEYKTIVVIHGHTFHNGTFQRLQPLAVSRSLRLICINRRGYPGTTPYSPEELKALTEGSESEKAAVLAQQGVNYALCVDGIIQKCGLSNNEGGGIALVVWSMGNAFLFSLLASITSLPVEIRERLRAYIKTIIMWEPPSHALGIPNPPRDYVPLQDDDLLPEARGPAFAKWVSSYYIHGDLSTRDLDELNYRTGDPSRKPSIENMTTEELYAITDFAAGNKGETIIIEPPFQKVLTKMRHKALFDLEVRSAWGGAKVWHLYGLSSTWNIFLSVWTLEKEDKEFQHIHNVQPYINFKTTEGANHFVMWDEPEKAMSALEDCLRSQ